MAFRFNKIIIILILSFVFLKTKAQSVGGTTSGGATYCSATNSGFVSVTGFVGSIQFWQSSTDGGVTWASNTNTTPNQSYFNLAQTTCYRAIVQNGAFPPDTSTIVCVTIYLPSIGGTLSGGGNFCVSSGPGSLNLTGNNGNVLYWLSSIDSGATWNTIANTTTTENYTNITQATIYQVVVQNGPMCPSDTSSQAIFTIYPASVAGTLSGATSVCSTSNLGSVVLSGNTGNITEWLSSTNSGATWTAIANTTSTQNYLNLSQTTWYQVIVQSGTCPPDTSSYAIIDVSTPSIAGTLSGGGIFCGTPATGVLNLTGNTGNVTGWQISVDSGATWGAISNTTTTQNYTGLTSTTMYLVTVQNGACPSVTSNIEIVYVFPQTVAGTINSNATVCYQTNNDSILLTGNVGNVLYWLSSTDGGITWNTITNTSTTLIYSGLIQTTQYSAVVQSGLCNIDTTNTVIITVLAQNIISAGNDTTITQGQTLTLNGSGIGISIIWSPASTLSNSNILNPIASPQTTTVYTLTITDIDGCVVTDNVIITVNQPNYNGMISNLFTPNGDGINDFWYLQDILNFPENEVFVYNIYGNQVYTKKGYTNDWNGTYNGSELPDGTYFYVVKFENFDKIIKGSLDILRNK